MCVCVWVNPPNLTAQFCCNQLIVPYSLPLPLLSPINSLPYPTPTHILPLPRIPHSAATLTVPYKVTSPTLPLPCSHSYATPTPYLQYYSYT